MVRVRKTFGHNFSILVVALLLILLSGVFVLLGDFSKVDAVLESDSNAVDIIGQYDDSLQGDYTKSGKNNGPNKYGMDSPRDVVMDETNNKMYIADDANGRVLVYNLGGANDPVDYIPDFVLGSDDFSSNTMGTFSDTNLGTNTRITLALDVTGNRLFVGDYHRLLVFDTGSLASGMAASNVLGSPNFTNSGSDDMAIGVTAANVGMVNGMTYDSNQDYLYVSDYDNHRILIFDIGDGIVDGEDAINVLGHLNFTSSDSGLAANKFYQPGSIVYDNPNDRLFVSDDGNNRTVVFDLDYGGGDPINDGRWADSVIGANDFSQSGDGSGNGGLAYDVARDYLYVDTCGATFGINVYDVETIDNGEAAIATNDFVYGSRSSFFSNIYYNSTKEYLYSADEYAYEILDASTVDEITYTSTQFGHATVAGATISDDPSDANNGAWPYGLDQPQHVLVDTENDRIYIFEYGPLRITAHNTTSGVLGDKIPDAVLGASDFYSVGSGGASVGFANGGAMAYDTLNNYLYVVDKDACRIMAFDVETIIDGESAQKVIGAPNLNSQNCGLSQNQFGSPGTGLSGLVMDNDNNLLFAADGTNNRVLVFNVLDGVTDGENAINVLGQADFTAEAVGTSESVMSSPTSMAYDHDRDYLFVVDNGAYRVLVYDLSEGITDGMNAANVLGQPDFDTGDGGTSDASGWQGSAYITLDDDTDRLFLADENGHRVLVFNVGAITDDMDASYVLGQASFEGFSLMDPSQSDFSYPVSVAFEPNTERLYVVAEDENRVLVFDAEQGPPEAPGACTISGVDTDALTVTWTAGSGATGYTLEISSNGTDWSTETTTNAATLTYDDSSLSSYTAYYYRVIATNAQGSSTAASCTPSPVYTLAEFPTSLAYSAPADVATEVALNPTFTMSSTLVDGDFVHYRLELSSTSDFKITEFYFDQRDSDEGWSQAFYESGDTASFTLPNTHSLTTNATYYWRFRAFGVQGTMAISSDVEEVGANRSFTTIVSSAEEDDDVAFADGLGCTSNLDVTNSTGTFRDNATIMSATNTLASATDIMGADMYTTRLEVLDVDVDGDLDILEFNDNSGQSSGNSYIHTNNGSGVFSQSAYSLGNVYADIIPGDLDEDGDIDLLKVGSSSNFWEENSGDGSFTSSSANDPISGNKQACALGDLDHDGDLDIACATAGTAANLAYLNNGSGTFTAMGTSPFTGSDNTDEIAIADMNADGWNDIVVGNTDSQSYLYLNDRDGTFTRSNAFSSDLSYVVNNILVEDFDNDGDLDVAEAGSDSGYIYFNDGTGTFSTSNQTFAFGYKAAAGDVDGDGDIDLVTATDTNAYLYRNLSRGVFSSSTSIYPDDARDVVIADFDGNGVNDIVLAINNGQNKYFANSAANDFIETSSSYAVFDVHDYDLDGDQDLLSLVWGAGGGLTLQMNDGEQNYTASLIDSVYSTQLCVLDVDGDGYRDVVVPALYVEGVVPADPVYINDGDGTFTTLENAFDAIGHSMNCYSMDADMDGDGDVIFTSYDGDMELWLNNGSGDFTAANDFDSVDLSTAVIAIADVDLDGDEDVVVSDDTDNEAALYTNDGSGNFTSTTLLSNVGTVGLVELTGDQYPELVRIASIQISIYKNNAGTFSSTPRIITYDPCIQGEAFAGLNLDDDNDNDLLISCGTDGGNDDTNFAMINNGDLNFSIVGDWFTDEDIYSQFYPGDYDSDGDMDFFVWNNDEDDEDTWRYENVQTFSTSATQNIISADALDSTADTIYSATLAATDYTPGTSAINYYLAAAVSDVWPTLDYPGSEDINGAFVWEDGSETMVVYGDNGEVYYTLDGSSFTEITGITANLNGGGIATDQYYPGVVGDEGKYYSLVGGTATELCVGLTTENLNAAVGDDASVYGFGVGDNGTIMRADFTDPDNIVCTLRDSGTSEHLYSITMDTSGGESAFAVGANGTFILTEDFGVTWITMDTGVSVDLNVIGFLGNTVTMAGDDGTLIQTTDGVDYTTVVTGTSENINGGEVFGPEASDWAYFVGDDGYVIWTDDSGDNWTIDTTETSTNLAGAGSYGETTYVTGPSGALYYDGGSSTPAWEGPVTSGSEWTFTASGSNLMWKAAMTTSSANVTPVLDSVSIGYSTSAGGDPPPPPPAIPSAPTVESADVLSSTSIQWNFADTSDNETGFKFYDGDLTLLETSNTPDSSSFLEASLSPNVEYNRSVSAFNYNGESSIVGFNPVYTLANAPAIETLTVASDTSINLAIDVSENSTATEYAIYEVSSQDWLQADGTIDSARIYQTYANWLNGRSAILIENLTNNAMYSFKVIARNGDDIETDFSDSENIIVYRPANASIVLTKKVGINEADEMVGIYFGQPVYASSSAGQAIKHIPFYSQFANTYLIIASAIVLLCLLLLLLNAHPKFAHAKHTHKILFRDLRGKNHDWLFELLHGKDGDKNSRAYKQHYHFYKLTSLGVAGVGLGIIVKVMIVLVAAVIVYGGVTVHAFENDSGADVYPNDVLTYELTYINNGGQTATNVVIGDAIPEGTTYVEASLSDTDNCTMGEMLYCEFASLASDETDTVEFKTTVTGAVGGTVVNYATGSFDQGSEAINSNSVTNDIISNIDPDLIGPGETFETILSEGWNYFKLAETAKVQFPHRSGTHAVELIDSQVISDQTSLRVTSDPIDVDIATGEITQVDSDGNSVNDLGLKTQSIQDDEIAIIGIMQVTEPEVDTPICGDATCNGAESCVTCSEDCGVCPPDVPVCGDATCNGDETCSNCETDCGICPPEPICGDTECNGSESCITCSEDCGICPPPAVCGNAACESGETCTHCEEDCGICETSPVCGDNLCNGFEDCSTCEADCGVCVPEGSTCGDNTCDEDEDCDSCEADCGECEEPPVGPVCGDLVCEGGEVCDVCTDDCGVCPTQGPFCGDSQCNGEETCTSCANDCGVCEDILDEAIDDIIAGDVLDEDVILIEDILDEKEEYDKSDKEREFELLLATEKVVEALKIEDKTVKAAVQSVLRVKQITLDNKIAEKINDIVEEPVIAAATVTSIAAVATVGASGAAGASVLAYLQFLITTPLGLFSRRKRKGWGIIYNSITKKPLDLAIVRLYNSETKKLVRTKVTDKLGRYQFIVKPGKYYIEVGKKEFAFPSKLLDNQQTDGQYLNVYYGGDIQITEDGVINQPIAVDPDKKDLSNSVVIKRFLLKRVQTVFTILGPILALISLVISPSWWIFGLFCAQIVMFITFKRLATGQKPTSFGTVMDKLKKNPLGRAVVRVFDTKFHKLLDTRITNGKGKYAFLVGNDVYYMTSEKNGYHPHRTDKVDLTSEDSGYLAEDIRMTPASMKLEQGQEDAVAVRSSVGRQEEKDVDGLKKVVRREEETFKGDIKDVELDDMHEEYYDVDVLSKK